jgi:hypothetical protein
MTHQDIVDHLFALANPDIAEHSQRFFKTGIGEYGYGDQFLGIRVPLIRQAVKKYKTVPLSDTEKLLRSEYHEIRLFALLLMVFQFTHGGSVEKEKIYNL